MTDGSGKPRLFMIRIDGGPQKYYSELFRQAANVLIAYADGMTAGSARPAGDDSGGSGAGITSKKDDGLGFEAHSGPTAEASPPPGPVSLRDDLGQEADDKATAVATTAGLIPGIVSTCGPIYQAGPALLPVASEMPTPREVVLVWGPDAYAEVKRRLT